MVERSFPCRRCEQLRSWPCGFSACPVSAAVALLAVREEKRLVGGRAPRGTTRELARAGVKRDMRR
ncbi:MAG TPA: hypothetical protein VEC60_01225, partial [Reyranella sp.]|nr:hypothetical protein [Reyranella sp.]